jgi:hypothetical protein
MPFNANCPGCGSSDPCGCSDPYSDKTASTDVKYTGPNLPATGIATCDDLSVSLQKIDYVISQIESGGAGTTTTTTSSSSTTSSTTTITTTVTTTAAPIGIEDITYASLYSKIINEELVPLQWYRLTDYRSVNFLNGWEIADDNIPSTDPNFTAREIYEGDVEVLILQAKSEYEISETAYSEIFTGDVIQYDGFTNKIGVNIGGLYNGNTLPNSTTISGFDLQWDGTNVYFNMPTGYPLLYGHYLYLYAEFDGGNYYQDGTFDPITPGISICQYPYTSDDIDYGYLKKMSRIRVDNNGMKVVLLDLDQTDFNNYDADSLYVDTVYAIGDAYGWIRRREDTYRKIVAPFDFRNRKYRRFEVDLSSINPNLGTDYYGQGDNFLGQPTTGNYKDYPSFSKDGADSFNVQWDDMGGPDAGWYCGRSDNFVCAQNFFGNTIKGFMCNSTILQGFVNCTIANGFELNTIAEAFQSNKIGLQFYSNTIAGSFTDNVISNNFYLNNIGQGSNNTILSESCYNNNIGNGFSDNTIQNQFYQNTIGNTFGGNTINDFYQNNVDDFFTNNTIIDLNNNTIGSGFNTNVIGTGSFNVIGDFFSTNIVGNNFFTNTIGNNFIQNTIGNAFQNNTITNDFRRNNFPIGTSVLFTNFTTSTHVYGNYDCSIIQRSDFVPILTYLNGSNVVQYVAINS